MLKSLRTIIAVSSLVLAQGNHAEAQTTLIHYWNFNNYALGAQYTDTIKGIAADFSILDTAKAKILYAEMPGTSAGYATHIDSIQPVATDYDTVNLRMGDTAGAALRVRNPSDSMQLYFYIPTTGYKNIVVNYASQSSSVSHGQTHQVFDYSVDSGASWRTAALSMPSDSAWLVYHRTTLTFTTDGDVNNNPGLVLRITFALNTAGTSGNNRFDNVTVEGDIIPTSVADTREDNPRIKLYPNPATNMVNIQSENTDLTPAFVSDITGRKIMAISPNASKFDISTLDAGNYFLLFVDHSSNTTHSVQFRKK